MNKKIVVFIIGLALILLGLLGWNMFNKANNLDKEVLEDISTQESVNVEETAIDNENSYPQENPQTTENRQVINKQIKSNNISQKRIINTPEPTIEVTPVLTEGIIQEKESEDPYVDENGNIVVVNEFRPPLKQKIFFRGVVYNIKTR